MRQLRFWKPNGTWQREINEHTDAWPSWCHFFLGDWICISMKEPGKSWYHLVPHLNMPIYMWLVRGLSTTYQVGCSNWHWWICMDLWTTRRLPGWWGLAVRHWLGQPWLASFPSDYAWCGASAQMDHEVHPEFCGPGPRVLASADDPLSPKSYRKRRPVIAFYHGLIFGGKKTLENRLHFQMMKRSRQTCTPNLSIILTWTTISIYFPCSFTFVCKTVIIILPDCLRVGLF